MTPGKRYTVYSIRPTRNGGTVWVRAGQAWVQPDNSMNIELDVLPIDGKLHVREPQPKPEGTKP